MAMRTRYGPYEFLIMSFRLCNASSTFTTFMNFVYHDKTNKWHLHQWHLGLFQVCRRTPPTFKVCVGKVEGYPLCQLNNEHISKLGNGVLGTCVVRRKGQNQPKENPIDQKWQSLVIAKGVRSFLRLANFYRKFIKDFLALAKLLTDLFKK